MQHSMDRRRLLAAVGATSTAGIAGCANPVGELRRATTDDDGEYIVAPGGSDANPGTSDAPLQSIETALERAKPGETVRLNPGEYVESVRTKRDGESDAPITITGPSDAVVRAPPDTGSVVRIQHNHIHLRGPTINGLIDPDRKFEDYNAWARNCVFISPNGRADEGIEYLYGVVVEPSRVGNTHKPIIQTQRIRDTTIGNFEVIGPAGMRYDPRVDNHDIGHVREILYIGSPEPRRKESYWPYDTLDRTRNIRIHHIDNSAGYAHNEFVDVKLGSTNVTIEYCTDRNAGHNTEANAEAAIILNGNNCTVRWNDIGQCPVPISVSPWAPSEDVDSSDWGRNHAIYGNRIHDFAAGVFQFRTDFRDRDRPPFESIQRVLCKNDIDRGSLDLQPWIPPTNGFDGTFADRSGQDEVTITVGAGSDGHAFDPPVVTVDPGTTINWEWVGEEEHYVIRRNRVDADPETVPPLKTAPYSESERFDDIGLERWACYNHHDEGMRATVLVADDEVIESATDTCESSIPSGDGIGHTGGDSQQ